MPEESGESNWRQPLGRLGTYPGGSSTVTTRGAFGGRNQALPVQHHQKCRTVVDRKDGGEDVQRIAPLGQVAAQIRAAANRIVDKSTKVV